MTDSKVGAVTWFDLTVADAERARDFYGSVVGWVPEGVDMDGYQDFNMNRPETGDCAVGICHARGPNSDLPAAWMIYINVADLDQSMVRCDTHGGEVIAGPKQMGSYGRYCVIRDPDGAVCALFEPT